MAQEKLSALLANFACGLDYADAEDAAEMRVHAESAKALEQQLEQAHSALRRYVYNEEELLRESTPTLVGTLVSALHPTVMRTKEAHDLYARAVDLVSERHAKFELVDLVYVLLTLAHGCAASTPLYADSPTLSGVSPEKMRDAVAGTTRPTATLVGDHASPDQNLAAMCRAMTTVE